MTTNFSLQTTKQPLQTIIVLSKVLNWKLQLAAQLAPQPIQHPTEIPTLNAPSFQKQGTIQLMYLYHPREIFHNMIACMPHHL